MTELVTEISEEERLSPGDTIIAVTEWMLGSVYNDGVRAFVWSGSALGQGEKAVVIYARPPAESGLMVLHAERLVKSIPCRMVLTEKAFRIDRSCGYGLFEEMMNGRPAEILDGIDAIIT